MQLLQTPTAVLLGTEREWRMRKGQLKLEEVQHHGYVIDVLSSLMVCFYRLTVQSCDCDVLYKMLSPIDNVI